MFERYTEKARRVIFFARCETSDFGSPYIETEHLLLGLLREDKALSLRFLKSLAPFESIRSEIEAHTVVRDKTPTSVDLPLSNECKQVLAYAVEEAERLAQKQIGTEHLLLGLLREEKCFAAEILSKRGVRLPELRIEMQRAARQRAHESGAVDEPSPVLSRACEELAANYLDVSLRKFDVMIDNVKTCLGKLTDAQLWERNGAHENTVGNLVLHLCGNARQWIISGVGGVPDTRTRDKEFSANGGVTGAELLKIFTGTMAEVRGVIAGVPAERLSEIVHPQGKTVTVLEAIFVVVTHVHQHVGQIILLTKQMTGKDLDLTVPRPR